MSRKQHPHCGICGRFLRHFKGEYAERGIPYPEWYCPTVVWDSYLGGWEHG